MLPIFSSSIPSLETRKTGSPPDTVGEPERLPRRFVRKSNEGAGVEVHGVRPWLEVQLFHLQRYDARDAFFHLDFP